ncbi:MAG: molybdate ABC transporter substrate-binding protein [Planctomycetota bacterium]
MPIPQFLFGALLLLGLPACRGSEADPKTTRVFAAASLTASFQDLAAGFESSHPGSKIELHFAGTPQLVVQVREGAPVDVVACADETNMLRIVETGTTVAAPVVFARNRLTIVTAKENPRGIRGLGDLARDDVRVLLCGPEVPAGRYARQAFERAGVRVKSLSDEPSVNAVVSKVQLAEVDAGVVYVTDATRASDRVAAVAIPDEQNVLASYPIVPLDAGANRAGGEAFVDFVLSPAGQGVLQRHGFSPP